MLTRRRAKSQEFFATAAGGWDRLRSDLFGDAFYLWAVLGLIDPTLVVGDLGCGTGQLTETVAPYVRQRHCGGRVDGHARRGAAARSAARTTSSSGRASSRALPIEDGELDAAMLSLVLHYSPAPATRARGGRRACVRQGGRVLVVDMLPHEREEYQQQMGHVWLGFSEKQMSRFLDGRRLRRRARADAAGRSGREGAGAVCSGGSEAMSPT